MYREQWKHRVASFTRVGPGGEHVDDVRRDSMEGLFSAGGLVT